MRRLLYLMPVLFFTSCATICGGKRYYAQVMIPNCPDADITYNGQYVGKSTAQFPVDRRDANKVVLSVSHPSYETRDFSFNKRSFRGWTLAGNVLLWTEMIPTGLPWGILVDGITGAWWKPSVREAGVTKRDNKHYVYTLDYGLRQRYETSKQEVGAVNQTRGNDLASKLEELKRLLDNGIITEEEYQSTRRKLLESYAE